MLNWQPPSLNPTDDYGDMIRRYKVAIGSTTENEFSYDLVNCDGENDHYVIDNQHCELPMATLQAAPFNLQIGQKVKAKIIAVNNAGESPESDTSGEAVSAQEPDAPVNLLRWDQYVTTSQIAITWDDGAFDGASPIIDYQVSYDQSSSVYQVIGIGITSREFITTASQVIGPGISYTFKV